MTKLSRWMLIFALLGGSAGVGCGPSADDAAGQAALIADPAKRVEAFQNVQRLWHAALTASGGDRTKAEAKAVIDGTIESLVAGYAASRADLRTSKAILDLLAEMQDPRAIPAFIQACDFELDAGEKHAQTAANAIRALPSIPAAQQGAVVTALTRAVNKLPGDRPGNDARPADKVVQIDLIKALGSVGEAAAPSLAALLTSTNEKTDPAVTLASAIYLARVANAESVPALIQGLFRTVAGGRISLGDFAIAGLVRVGRPAVDPLIRVFNGQDPAAITAATAALAAMRAAGQQPPASMTPQSLAKDRAMRGLAALGVPEAFPLMAQLARTGEIQTRFDAALMMTQLTLPAAQQAEARTLLISVLDAATGDANAGYRNGLLSIALQTLDAGFLPTVMNHVRSRTEYAQVRLTALTTYAMLANKAEATQLKALIDAEPTIDNDGLKEQFTPALPVINLAIACDESFACWKGKLGDEDPLTVRKAVIMIGRFGVNNNEAIAALVPLLEHAKLEVRLAAVYALDHMATAGSAEVVAKLDDICEREDPVSLQFRTEALRIASRIRSRAR